jgi:cysteine desulfurase
VVELMTEVLPMQGNPSSVHRFGRLARRLVEDARERVAALAGALPEEVIFTSGGTEANDLALNGTVRARVVISAIEHDSVLAAVPDAERLPVDENGLLRLDALEEALQREEQPALVSVMTANNETGVVQPIPEIAGIARRYGALLHTDAVQAAGKMDLIQAARQADLVTLSAHKFGGPQGVGALIVRGDVKLAPRHRGGGQERRRRAGTENVAGIAGFGKAAELAHEGIAHQPALADLRDRLESVIAAASPETEFFGRGAPRLANTSCFTMPGVGSETQVMALDIAGIAVSAGSACSSGKVKASHVLEAMGAAPSAAESAIRISMGWETAEEDIDRFVDAWTALRARTVGGGASKGEAAAE